MTIDFAELRREYRGRALLENEVDRDPMKQFNQWFDEATRLDIDMPNTMALATLSPDGKPCVRYVLLKAVDEQGLVFYTHSVSTKGRQLAANPNASLVFYWQPVNRQVRLEGVVERVSDKEADSYFQSRPYGSQISAWVAPQSAVVSSREFMEQRVRELEAKYPEGKVPRPNTWGGYRLVPGTFEFWQGRENRLHDRIVYQRAANNEWTLERLAP